ncbi:toprim domain-containing protein, partial [Flavobacterium psychrophilum]
TNSFSFQKQEKIVQEKEIKQYKILEIKAEIQNQSLIKYLNSRKIFKWDSSIVEIHYKLNQRNYFAIGFKNDQFGYDIRNQFFKGCLLKKAPTTIKNNANTLTVFEGFFCYLTYINSENEISDFIILNSVSNLKKCINQLANYEKIYAYLDNDFQGQKATEEILKLYPNAIDCRFKYQNHKDLNDFLTGQQYAQS